MNTNIVATLGPSFPSEILAAGLGGKAFSFGLGAPGYVLVDDSMAAADLTSLKAVIAAHDATKPAPAGTPADISDRQFARGLWGDGIISYSDFLGFIGPGSIPAPIQAIVNALPDDNTGAPTARKDAVGFLTGSKLYQFSHPLVEFFRQSLAANDAKWTKDYLVSRWLVWATL